MGAVNGCSFCIFASRSELLIKKWICTHEILKIIKLINIRKLYFFSVIVKRKALIILTGVCFENLVQKNISSHQWHTKYLSSIFTLLLNRLTLYSGRDRHLVSEGAAFMPLTIYIK